MQTIPKINEIDTRNSNFTNKFLLKTSLYSSSDKWFKGSRSRGIRWNIAKLVLSLNNKI